MKNKLDTGLIKQLRETTNAGIIDCKAALIEAEGDLQKAVVILRKKGVEMATKKASRAANQGCVEAYIHHGAKLGVLLEVNCETDFVAKNDDFKKFVREMAMQIAAAGPRWISRDDVPVEVIESERHIIKEQMKGKPAQAAEKAIPGKLEKFYQQACLLEQPFIKDEKVFVKDLLASLVGKIGENIIIRRFARFQVGIE